MPLTPFFLRSGQHIKATCQATSEPPGRLTHQLFTTGGSLWLHTNCLLAPDTRILLNVDMEDFRRNESIDVHYLDRGGTSFSFVTRVSIPPSSPIALINPPELAFSADGSKFAVGMACGRVSIWNIQSNVPLQTFAEVCWPRGRVQPPRFLQFSSGKLGKEILVFVEVRLMFTF